jgi:hypothetical protein
VSVERLKPVLVLVPVLLLLLLLLLEHAPEVVAGQGRHHGWQALLLVTLPQLRLVVLSNLQAAASSSPQPP